ncbi:hypothetical protein MK079_03765, partial [Candidatus Gracilibacteria bacterium]|nr:hypothetical protein [Candidatus Gracilibacteria bacterium]
IKLIYNNKIMKLNTLHNNKISLSEQITQGVINELDTTNLTISQILDEDDHIGQSMSDFLDTIDRQRAPIENINKQLAYLNMQPITA